VNRALGLGSACAFAVLGLAFCHPAEPPPVAPPKPTDPSIAELIPGGEVIDASIVTEGGTAWDGDSFGLDTGAGIGRAVPSVTSPHLVAPGPTP